MLEVRLKALNKQLSAFEWLEELLRPCDHLVEADICEQPRCIVEIFVGHYFWTAGGPAKRPHGELCVLVGIQDVPKRMHAAAYADVGAWKFGAFGYDNTSKGLDTALGSYRDGFIP